jgi:hypothetical protein
VRCFLDASGSDDCWFWPAWQDFRCVAQPKPLPTKRLPKSAKLMHITKTIRTTCRCAACAIHSARRQARIGNDGRSDGTRHDGWWPHGTGHDGRRPHGTRHDGDGNLPTLLRVASAQWGGAISISPSQAEPLTAPSSTVRSAMSGLGHGGAHAAIARVVCSGWLSGRQTLRRQQLCARSEHRSCPWLS